MSRRPLLLFPTPDTTSPSRRNGGGEEPHKPSVTRQGERLSPQFSRLEAALENRRIEVQNDTPGVDPEYTVVIETYSSVPDFFKAVRQIEGLEWLGEHEARDLEPDEDFYSLGSDSQSLLNGQVMLMLSDRRAIDELLSLWREYGQNPNMPFTRGWAKFRDLFSLLKDIRYWNTQDRLRNTGILEYWNDVLEFDADTSVRFEAELWFRTDIVKRENAHNNVTRLTQELGGQVISSCCIPDINYQSLLIELPAGQIENILRDSRVNLIRCDQVMLFRPLGQMSVEPLWSDTAESSNQVEEEVVNYEASRVEFDRLPRVALFDGLPLANHLDLRGSLIVDDPDDFESDYPAENRIHGTAMASLIVNGDLTEGARKLESPVYVRPIMKPDVRTANNIECLPDTELPLDIVHRAVRRLFEYDGEQDPVAPSIKVINLSIGDPNIHFNGKMSPFARLLDWLSSKYNVLFVVSAGNHSQSITVQQSGLDFHHLSDDRKATEIFKALQESNWERKLLSPAESVNAITVGSTHSDESTPVLRNGLYNIYDVEMPATYSAQGNGYARAVKPDIVMPGGKMLHNEAIGSSDISAVTNYAAPGQLVAHPSPSASNYRVYIRGTSNSAALASRGCVEICDTLEGLFDENDQNAQFEQYSPLLLKSLITHGASWGSMHDHISNHLGSVNSSTLKNVVARNIGYGKPDIDRVKFCLDTRATIIGYGVLENSEAHVYKLPIPEGLGGADIWRRLTVSLSWFAKPCPTHMKYRDSALWFTVEGENKDLTARSSKSVDWRQVKRGTLQHEVFEGEELAVITEDRTLLIKVNCKDNASRIVEPIKYGLAITLEVAEGVDIQLYQEIQEVIEEQIREQARAQLRAQVPTR
ncbi:S8 family peptidase [Shewanella canadensis]|uniref:S8 family peptidase n=1 Tax=Shewanella canadensis TaxID=271096 RepID=A0A431WSJ8_9GAMM|nr:S8 family peptidase [Shewanella canadensis]RTR38195.1 S8 family peptidase [Shewanella canadensis]